MALYRLTQAGVSRITTGRVPGRAFVATSKNERGAGIEGMDFRDLIDVANRTFNMPPALRPVSESLGPDAASGAQPTTRCEISLGDVQARLGVAMPAAMLSLNRNFECDLPLGDCAATPIANALVAAGLLAAAGALADANVPAALNVHLSGMPVRA